MYIITYIYQSRCSSSKETRQAGATIPWTAWAISLRNSMKGTKSHNSTDYFVHKHILLYILLVYHIIYHHILYHIIIYKSWLAPIELASSLSLYLPLFSYMYTSENKASTNLSFFLSIYQLWLWLNSSIPIDDLGWDSVDWLPLHQPPRILR